MARGLISILAGGVIGRGLALTHAVAVFIAALPALASHPSHGGGEAGGGTSYDAILPIVIAVAVLMVGAVLWGRKKPKTKSKARSKAQPKARSKPRRVKRNKRRR